METTIVGMNSLMEMVQFHYPINFSPENIPSSKKLKSFVRSTCAVSGGIGGREETDRQDKKKR